ncbi:MAG TPA: DoxX family protein [Pseudolysinimonas sp.]|nr:DoxX family protein [Pseudolysinimonas sp.]
MLIALWIVNILLALAFIYSGITKVVRSRTELQAKGMGYVEDLSDGAVTAIGVVEALGAVGLIVPLATGIVPILTPLAAVGLAATMLGASIVHIRRKESPVASLVLLVAAIASAALGFLTL